METQRRGEGTLTRDPDRVSISVKRELADRLAAKAREERVSKGEMNDRIIISGLGGDGSGSDPEPSAPTPEPAPYPTPQAIAEMERKERAPWLRGDDVKPEGLDAAIDKAVQGVEGNRDNAKFQTETVHKIHAEANALL